MKTEIPAQRIITCDFCGTTNQAQRFRKEFKIKIERTGLDILGDPSASGVTIYDACDHCGERIDSKFRAANAGKERISHVW